MLAGNVLWSEQGNACGACAQLSAQFQIIAGIRKLYEWMIKLFSWEEAKLGKQLCVLA